MQPFKHLEHRREHDVEHIVLNRPSVRNAFNAALIDEITTWAAGVVSDPSVRAVVLAGAGDCFCAGADLNWMSEMIAYSYDENVRDAQAMRAMFEAINGLRVPVIAKVQGAALGGGCGLVAVADIAVADDRCVFGFTEVKLGLVPAVIAPFVISKIGQSAARELFTMGSRFDAAHALRIGLVHRVVPMAELDIVMDRQVSEVVSNARSAVAATKQLLAALHRGAHDDAGTLTVNCIAAQRISDEGQEGMMAFLQKRRPRWASQADAVPSPNRQS